MSRQSAMDSDFIVVGAGSAGAALAHRLSEDGRHSVCLVEFGGTDMGPLIQMPAALSYPMNMSLYDWGYRTEPEPHLGGRQLACPRGKVIGGSSSINGMVYVRGNAGDYDHWASQGAEGWGFADVLPYFQRMETSHGGESGWRGGDGPLHVTRGPAANPLFQAFIEAGKQAGFPVTEDYNGAQQEGFAVFERTIWQGRRWSTANAYLKPALARTNVSLRRGLVRRVTVEEGQATGVELDRGGQVEWLHARRAVVLAAGSINSPKILMHSGIGPADHLAALGIDALADRPGVGANLQDHLELYVQQACIQPVTLYSRLNLAAKAAIGLQWLLFKTGDGASNHFESGAFLRSAAGVEYPDIQFHFLPVAIRYDGTAPAQGHGFQVHVGPMRSPSRGRVRLSSADPREAPSILFNYMSDPKDWADFRHCIRLAREIFGQPAMDPFRGAEIAPGESVQDDQQLDDFIRQAVESAYHPCGTCRLGAPADPLAVVDPQCRVIGVDRLFLADSSIFPRIPNGNLNGPSIMVGEKAADHILGRGPLAASSLVPRHNPRWREADR